MMSRGSYSCAADAPHAIASVRGLATAVRVSPPGMQSSFIFATCNAGAEPSLKEEMTRLHGARFRPAFMRPQLITWKCGGALSESYDLGGVYARASGLSFGLCKTDEEIVTKAASTSAGTPFHLHLFPRECAADTEPDETWRRMDALRERLAAAGLSAPLSGAPVIGDWVLDLIYERDSDACLVGAHQHSARQHPQPGGLSRGQLPAEAPSRAFLKMEQALAWRGFDGDGALAGMTALELGCAPGGGTYALLRRGVEVTGVDTGEMDARVLAFTGPGGARLTHVRESAGAVSNATLPERVDLLISDMNLAPPVVIKYVEALQRRVRARMLLLTLKMNDREMESKLPDFIGHIARFAPGEVHTTQLQANRREITVFAAQKVVQAVRLH